jgi:hypothetical protein
MTTWGDPELNQAEEHTEWLAQPDGKPPRLYITRISVPRSGGGVLQRLHSRMKEPEPEPEAGA